MVIRVGGSEKMLVTRMMRACGRARWDKGDDEVNEGLVRFVMRIMKAILPQLEI